MMANTMTGLAFGSSRQPVSHHDRTRYTTTRILLLENDVSKNGSVATRENLHSTLMISQGR